jgi:hypothetical protein
MIFNRTNLIFWNSIKIDLIMWNQIKAESDSIHYNQEDDAEVDDLSEHSLDDVDQGRNIVV